MGASPGDVRAVEIGKPLIRRTESTYVAGLRPGRTGKFSTKDPLEEPIMKLYNLLS